MLPVRDGVGPSQVGLPPGPWARMLDFLVERFPAIAAQEWTRRMDAGLVVDDSGSPVAPGQAYLPHGKLYYYRDVAGEVAGLGPIDVLFEDELLVVADKPHFLAVTPSGKYLRDTLLVRLRRQLGIAALTPLHRLDRDTAGVVLFAKERATCTRYHRLFDSRAVAKTYQAIAACPTLEFPITRASRIVDGAHFMQMREVAHVPAQPPNAHTEIAWMETRGPHARYRLRPTTGARHQLRVHMAALGLPILGDRIYPDLLPAGEDDPANPLRLLAQAIAFQDPVTGQSRSFTSLQQLHFPPDAQSSPAPDSFTATFQRSTSFFR